MGRKGSVNRRTSNRSNLWGYEETNKGIQIIIYIDLAKMIMDPVDRYDVPKIGFTWQALCKMMIRRGWIAPPAERTGLRPGWIAPPPGVERTRGSESRPTALRDPGSGGYGWSQIVDPGEAGPEDVPEDSGDSEGRGGPVEP